MQSQEYRDTLFTEAVVGSTATGGFLVGRVYQSIVCQSSDKSIVCQSSYQSSYQSIVFRRLELHTEERVQHVS